ncbi:unnamed protein product [Cyprideis torosa]|uniref:inositol-polyphosphate 5-phosphatase n=1 Tax=Cyprideis torosa TaxID=163714 RepID=A0A7R8ZR69_9CRUS|nr:unnamed protein product [Cyprideis torosa]CAG0893602.1 unnamed protein product [Cyprideis torosa]
MALPLNVLLVTANVGSVFEDPECMLKDWVEVFLSTVESLQPSFIALHCQEVGGKNYETSMKFLSDFQEALSGSHRLDDFTRSTMFLDANFTCAETFTALGSIYFVHKDLPEPELWDFEQGCFVSLRCRDYYSGDIEAIPTKEKDKFPFDLFPELRELDMELTAFSPYLCEFPLDFPPSYPFVEEPGNPWTLMRTRIPAWCDRVLFSATAKDIILDGAEGAVDVQYSSIGKDICTGDHKPVFLFFTMADDSGTLSPPSSAPLSVPLRPLTPPARALVVEDTPVLIPPHAHHLSLRRCRTQPSSSASPPNPSPLRGNGPPINRFSNLPPPSTLKKYFSSTLEDRPPPRRHPAPRQGSRLKLSMSSSTRRSTCHHSSSEEEWFEKASSSSSSDDSSSSLSSETPPTHEEATNHCQEGSSENPPSHEGATNHCQGGSSSPSRPVGQEGEPNTQTPNTTQQRSKKKRKSLYSNCCLL